MIEDIAFEQIPTIIEYHFNGGVLFGFNEIQKWQP